MALKCGIIGLPNVGKSTFFNALTASNIPSENYPFCTIEPHLGIVPLPDPRLEDLKKIYLPEKVTSSTVEFTDIAGLVRGASRGEGLGNRFLGQIRQTSAIIHVIRCFEDKKIHHVEQSVDPIRDIETIETELLLADIETIESSLMKTQKSNDLSNRERSNQCDYLSSLLQHCSDGERAEEFPTKKKMIKFKKSLHLLTDKPLLYISNIDEDSLNEPKKNPHYVKVNKFAESKNRSIIYLCARLEEEIVNLNNEERNLFFTEYNIKKSGLDRVIRKSFELLRLQTFFTCGAKEVRSWTTYQGTCAHQAAGIIHSDFMKGFIKADIFHFNEIIKYGSEKKLKELGLIRQEGKEYLVKDGDCIYFRFNV